MHKTLFVHIGVHKTGTTAIQTHFAVYSPFFRCFGLNYPRLGGRFRYRNQDVSDDIRQSEGNFQTLDRYLASVEKSKCAKHLLSAETFFTLKRAPEFFARFKKLAEVRILFFVRRQDRFLESLYRQMVKNESTAASLLFGRFVRNRVRPKSGEQPVNWLERIRPWASEFGKENIHIIPYSEYDKEDSVAIMGRILQVPTPGYLPRLDMGDNSSLCCETIEFLRQARGAGLKYHTDKLSKLDHLVQEPSHAYLSMDKRQALLNRFVDSNQTLGTEFACPTEKMLEFREEIESRRKIFALDTFDFEQMKRLAVQCGLLKKSANS